MAPAGERVTSYLADDESLRGLTSGTLLEDATQKPIALGLTDRRVLSVSETGEFTDIRYDYICSIRSNRHSTVRYQPQEGDRRTARFVGALLAMAALVVAVVYASSAGASEGATTVLLSAATVGTVASIQYVRTRSGDGAARRQLLVGTGILLLSVLVGIGLLSSSVLAHLFVVLTPAGLVLLEYARRHRGEFGRSGLRRQREKRLTINTIDGHTVRVAIDADADIDRELTTYVHQGDPNPVDPPVARSSVR